MPRLFYGNFDFEHSLGNRGFGQLPRNLLEVNANWCLSLIPLMKPGDFLWIPELLVERGDFWKDRTAQAGVRGVWQVEQIPRECEIEFVPWGWTNKIIRWANTQGWKTDHPEMRVVVWANSRATSFEYEQQWDSAPPGAIEVHQVDQLENHLLNFSDDSKWVMKAEFSMSARERVIGQGRTISQAMRNWLHKRLQNGGRVFFEPWLERIEEMSFHFEISSAEEVFYLGMTQLLTDESGRYLENRPVREKESLIEQKWRLSRLQTMQLAREYARKKYRGPLSIDAMRYYDAQGQPRERPLQDVNARYSMGRCEWEKQKI